MHIASLGVFDLIVIASLRQTAVGMMDCHGKTFSYLTVKTFLVEKLILHKLKKLQDRCTKILIRHTFTSISASCKLGV